MESKSNLFEKCINSALQPLEYTLGKTIYVIISMDRNDEEGVILAAMTIRRLNQTVIIANKILRFFNEFHRLIPSGYLIVISSLENLERMLKRIDVEHYNWYPRSRFVIVFSKTNVSPSNTARHSVEKAVIMLREYDINDVLVLSVDLHNTVQAFVWFPFSVRNQCRSEVHVTLLDRCTFERSTFVKNLYPSKIPFKFRGCTVTMSGFHWPPYVYVDDQTKNFNSGYNVETMNLLAERHNLTLRQILPEEGSRWGSLLDNGTWTGGLGLLQNSKADVSMGGSLETVMRINRFDFSNTYNSIYMKFYLLLPSKLPHWKNMIDIFSPEFWAIILAVYFIISAMMYFVSILNRDMEKEYYKNFANCLLTLWKVAFGNSANCIPNSPAVRIYLLSFMFHVKM